MNAKDNLHQTGHTAIQMLTDATSFLFVPGDRPERFPKALASEADIVIIDWEASVIPDRKMLARQATQDFLSQCSETVKVAIRVNPVQSDFFVEDCIFLRSVNVSGVFLTMVESVEDLDHACQVIPERLPFVAMIETAKGLIQSNQIASVKRVCRIAFGNMDYQTNLGLPDDPAGMIYPSSVIAVASRSVGLPQPIAGVTADFTDLQAFQVAAALERSLGFTAKMCIHPKQIEWTHAAFRPSELEINWANEVIEASRHSHAVQIKGVMIDRPVIQRANAILQSAANFDLVRN